MDILAGGTAELSPHFFENADLNEGSIVGLGRWISQGGFQARPDMQTAGGARGPSPHQLSRSEEPADWIFQVARHADRDCFIALFEYYAPRIKAYLMRLGLAEGVSEDLAQETMLRVWRRAEAFDPQRASPAAWIFTIARNLRIDALRRERHPDDLTVADDRIGPNTPEDELGGRQAQRRLRAAMNNLPKAQSHVLQLAFFDERSHADIARQLGLPLGTVKSRIRLASASLRLALLEFA